MPKRLFKKGDGRTDERRKGGRKKSKRKTLANSLQTRKNCNRTCRINDKCPFFELSQKEKGKPCLYKKANSEAQKRIMDILVKGTPETIEEYKRIIVRMGKAFDDIDSIKGMAIYADKVKDLHEMMFGKKIKQEVKTEGTIEVTWIEPKKGNNSQIRKR